MRRKAVITISAGTLLLVLIACLFLDAVVDLPPPTGGSPVDSFKPVLSPGHWLGTDANGNDIASRLLAGGRNSLVVASMVALFCLAIGSLIGTVSVMLGGRLDAIITRSIDALLAFPSLVMTLLLVYALGPGMAQLIVAMSFAGFPVFVRVARAESLHLRDLPFVTSASLSGRSRPRILLIHILPIVLPPLALYAASRVGQFMIAEGAMSILGFGLRQPTPSWGNMIAEGQRSMLTDPMLVLVPCAALFITVLAINFLSSALREARVGARLSH